MLTPFGIYEPANLDKLETENFDLRDYAEERRVIGQYAGEYAIVTSLLDHHFRKRSKRGRTKMASDANRVEHHL
jgi:hypothetical protein